MTENLAKLFGSSGVRGLVNIDLTPVLACRVGLAVATYSKARKALVARDTRVSGSMLEDALVSGLVAGGVDVSLTFCHTDKRGGRHGQQPLQARKVEK